MEFELPNLSLSYLVAELKPLLEGSFVNKVQGVSLNTLKFRLRTKEGQKDLIVSPAAFYFSSFKSEAKQTGFAQFLKKRIANRRISSVQQHESDRVVVLEIADTFLVFEFFGDGNIVLCDKSWEIIQPFRRGEWKDRSLKKGAEYVFPASKGKSPLSASAKEILSLESRKGIASALIANYNVAPLLAEECLAKAEVKASAKPDSLSQSEAESIAAELKALYSLEAKPMPVLARARSSLVLLPFPLSVAETERQFSSLNEGLDELLSSEILSETPADAVQQKSRSERLEHSINAQHDALQRLEGEAKEFQEKAELIQANVTVVQELLSALNSGFEK
ncbi:MAG: NFACT family protein, partial [archaeon]